ncbi:MAG: hypothetical protein M3Z35_04065 [Nitrospirota bacterium]|nr:hypothetical protein [Nitrospirota bacterium]
MGSKKHAFLAAAVLLFLSLIPAQVLAISCMSGTFADYIGLGTIGCTIEDKVFANFHYSPDPNFPLGIGTGTPTLPGVTFSSNPPAEQISVVPLA